MNSSPILYAEDDEHDVFFLQHAFQTVGITNSLQIARDGLQAIDYLSKQNLPGPAAEQVPGLIMLDLKMPRVSGLEVLAWLRQESNLPRLPVLILSSSAHPDEVRRAFALGANAFVVKPLSVAERLCLANAIKEFWLRFNQPQLGGLQAAA